MVEAASDGAIVQCAAKFWGAECAAGAVPPPMWLWQQRIQSRVEVMCLLNFSLSYTFETSIFYVNSFQMRYVSLDTL